MAQPHPLFDRFIAELRVRTSLSEEVEERAVRAANASNERLDTVLVRLGMVTDDAVAQSWASVMDLPFIDAETVARTDWVDTDIRPQFVSAHGLLPVQLGADLVLLRVDPLSRSGQSSLRYVLGDMPPLAIAPSSAVQAQIDKFIASTAPQAPTADQDRIESDLKKLEDLASDAPVIQWVNDLFDRAVAAGASDIHIEPIETETKVRLRIDGTLRADRAIAPGLQLAVISRVKLLAGLDIAEQRLPQDGRHTTTVRGRQIDLRVASAPTPEGETLVIRVLDPERAQLSLEDLGLAKPALLRFRKLLAAPNGIVLVTGPTGAGKTTTLYAALRETQSEDRKLMSVEDPVEYSIPGVTQIQASHAIGLDFARVLQSLLRHNPDVVMVGEIRNRETAEIAIEAALTGHLVLSTLHTNSAAAALTRLREMGAPSYLLGEVIRGIVAQRLARRLCPKCSTPRTTNPETLGILGLGVDVVLKQPTGCSACSDTGYRGRIAVNEILVVDDNIRRLIISEADEAKLSAAAIDGGMLPLLRDGANKAAAGLISVEDVLGLAGAG